MTKEVLFCVLLGVELRFIREKRHRSGGDFIVTGGHDATTGGKRAFTGEGVTGIKTRTVKERR
ncbi:hypothetical protein [Bacillus sp. E(2018)]|uniref:hypothetical protein n=1 Tax=Bacillus sp. E(2018) TaxID=2502239 RepID=UPI0010F96203|nr:hypothetical protein [Bacillus sp. E(2018)]